MNGLVGWPQSDGTISGVTDGNGCYGPDGKCFCAECYYYGSNAVNCANAGDFKGAKPVHWNAIKQKWVLDE